MLQKTRNLALAALTASPLANIAAANAQTATQPAYTPSYATTPITTPMVGNTMTYTAPPVAHHDCGIFETCPSTKIGLGKGDFLLRASALGVIPENKSSNVSLIGGTVHTTNQVMPELTAQYFFTDNFAIDLIAASTRHELSVHGSALGKVDLGSTWVLPPTLTASWHFRPHKRFNPYIGVGLTVAFFYAIHPAGGAVNKMQLSTAVGPTADIGFDYQLAGNWFLNFDAKQMFLNTTAFLNDRPTHGQLAPSGPFIKAHDSLDPTVVAMGIGYRF